MSDKDDTQPQPDLKPLLDHARSLFIFHATQRLHSIRYYFAIYAVFVAGYIAVLREQELGPAQPLVLTAIASLGTFISCTYRALDRRNAVLVAVD